MNTYIHLYILYIRIIYFRITEDALCCYFKIVIQQTEMKYRITFLIEVKEHVDTNNIT